MPGATSGLMTTGGFNFLAIEQVRRGALQFQFGSSDALNGGREVLT